MEVYLDHAATTNVLPAVQERVIQVWDTINGNPSSLHRKGFEAERCIEEAKMQIAAALRVKPRELVFTSGGTESNNLALLGSAFANQKKGKHLITTQIEHASVRNTMNFLQEQGFRVTRLPVDQNGQLSEQEFAQAVCEDTILVSFLFVNNEMGAVQKIKQLVHQIRQKKDAILIHIDAVQALGKCPLFPMDLDVDLVSLSGHKIHAPKGIGALWIREKTKIRPLLFGGGQQNGIRPGTENVAAIAGFGLAVQEATKMLEQKREILYQRKKQLLDGLLTIPSVLIHGMHHSISLQETAPHILTASFLGVRSEVLLHALEEKQVYVSAGSACASHGLEKNHTLQALGVSKEALESSIRFSFSVETTEEQISYVISVLQELVPMLRKYQAR